MSLERCFIVRLLISSNDRFKKNYLVLLFRKPIRRRWLLFCWLPSCFFLLVSKDALLLLLKLSIMRVVQGLY
jgi:hypothetical protein